MKSHSYLIILAMLFNYFNMSDSYAGVIILREHPLLFVDDAGIEKYQTVVRTIHQAKREEAPVLKADKPWEQKRVYLATVEHDSKTNDFYMWYLSRIPPNAATQLLYATSKDGMNWKKPLLGLFSVQGSRQNNVLDFIGDGGGEASVIIDPFEKNKAKRYKLLIHNRVGYSLGYSSDGIHWKEYPGNPVFKSGDTAKLTQNPITGEYLAYIKLPAEVNGIYCRVVWLSRSMDFKTWSEPELVFAPDKIDNDWTLKPDERTEIYLMSVFPHAAGFIGLPAMFYHMPQVLDGSKTANGGELSSRGGAVPQTGPMDIQLVSSSDGRKWKRSSPRIPIIKRGPPGTYDGGAIYNADSSPVHVGNETWIYYTAINTGHGAPIPPKYTSIGVAKFRRHGYVSLDAGPEGGFMETKLLRFTSSRLLINANSSRGQLQVALLEADGSPIQGYRLKDSIVLKEDKTNWMARWNNMTDVPTDRPIKILIKMANTQLYSLENRQSSD
jgi:hypothetical protein